MTTPESASRAVPNNPAPPAQRDEALCARLDSLLGEAATLIDQLQGVGAEQRLAVESGQVSQIVEVVAKREPIVRSIVRVGEELGAFIENPASKGGVGEKALNAALLQIAGFEHTMKRLREQDHEDQAKMERSRDQLAAQLSSMSTGQSALRAYSSRTPAPNPTMQDRRG